MDERRPRGRTGGAIRCPTTSSGMELERRALVMLVGMIWVPPFELGPHGKSATHPDGGHEDERDGRASCACPGQFCGRDPVVLVKVLIDPDGHWPVDSECPYAIGAATDAMIRLNRCIRSARGGVGLAQFRAFLIPRRTR
jgi:hypothetical protein